jgi:hypothetical protein
VFGNAISKFFLCKILFLQRWCATKRFFARA